MKPKFLYLLFLISFIACQSSDNIHQETTTSLNENIISTKKNDSLSIEKEEKKEETDPKEKSVFDYYDEVYEQTLAWNKAINEQNETDLEKVYATTIKAYGTSFSKSALVKDKMNWLSKHPNYHQKIGEQLFNVFFRKIPLNGKKTVIYGSTFTKITIENGVKKEYQAELLFKEENGKLKISIETDLTSILYIGNQTKGASLPNGKHYFAIDAFYDTRRDTMLAHDQVRVSSEITFEIKNGLVQDGMEYSINRYSGYTRGISSSIILDGQIENDKIYLETAYYSDRSDDGLEELKEKERDYTTIKVIDKNRIIILKPQKGETFPLTIGDYLYRYPKK